jgi:hypothetical protein
MITKNDVADYINANIETVLTTDEIKMLQDSISGHPAKRLLVETLIDTLGDVSILIDIRDNH